MPKALDPAERQAILDDIQAGKLSRNAIARKHGRSVGTVTNIANSSGLDEPFDRSQTEKGTQARQVDLAELRSLTSARFLQEANKMLDRLNEPCEVFAFGGAENRFNSEVLHRPPSAEARNFIVSAATALDKHLVLDRHDSDDKGGAAVDSWLRHMLGGTTQA